MATLKLEQNRRTIMAIPSYLIAGKTNALTYDDKAGGYATATGSKLITTTLSVKTGLTVLLIVYTVAGSG